ncbi:MAG: hypothetical protein O4965_05540 [Trichodesmium sp. St19_bin1]|nr:hypothetical protein [Trichodesmium sp. St19_bin1]
MRKYDFQRVAVEIVFPSDIKVRLKFSARLRKSSPFPKSNAIPLTPDNNFK